MTTKKNRSLFLIIVLFSILGSLSAVVQLSEYNPAEFGDRTNWLLGIPVLNFKVDVGNSLLNFTQLEIFDKDRYDNGHVMTDSEKKLLTQDDLIINSGLNLNLLEIGYRNYNLRIDGYGFLNSKVLDKKYTELALYGNETNKEYVFKAGEDSKGYAFLKASFAYSYPKPLNLGMVFKANKEKNSFWNDVLDYPVYAGINLNLYRSIKFFHMDESIQRFGSMDDSLYYNYYSKYYFTDDDSKGKYSLGLGFGFKFLLPEGQVHLSLDDICAKLNFEDLAGGEFEGEYVDYLLYFHNDEYDPFDESYENDSLRVKSRSVSFNPTFRFIAYHQIYSRLDLILKYQSSSYEYPMGLAGGINYSPWNFLPLQFITGYDDNVYFGFTGGLHFKNIEYTLGVTFFHGFFNHARGLGFTNILKIKF